MEIIIEFFATVILEGSIEVIKNPKISKWIRVPLLIIVSSLFLFIVGLFAYFAMILFEKQKLFSIVFVVIAIFLLILFALFIKKTITNKGSKEQNNLEE